MVVSALPLAKTASLVLALAIGVSVSSIAIIDRSAKAHTLIAQSSTSEQVASDLVQALLDDDRAVRKQSFDALKALGAEIARSSLEQALKDNDWQLRVIAAYNLGQLGTDAEKSIPFLLDALEDRNVDVRFSAAQALGIINSAEGIPALLLVLQEDKDENVRFAAKKSLLELGLKLNATELHRFMLILIEEDNYNHERARNRNRIQEFTLLDAHKAKANFSIPIFVEALYDPNWFIRETAILKLKEIASNEELSFEILLQYQNSVDGFIRAALAEILIETNFEKLKEIGELGIKILGSSGSEEAIPILVQYLSPYDGEYSYVSGLAAYALGEIGTESAIEEIFQRLDSGSYGIPIELLLQLEYVDSEKLTNEFTRRLKSENFETQIETIALAKNIKEFPGLSKSIKQLKLSDALSILLPALLVENPESTEDYSQQRSTRIRAGAVNLLAQLPHEEVISAVLQNLSEAEATAAFFEASRVAISKTQNTIVYSTSENTVQLSNEILKRLSDQITPRLIEIMSGPPSTRGKIGVRGFPAKDLLLHLAKLGIPEAVLALQNFPGDYYPNDILLIAQQGYNNQVLSDLIEVFWTTENLDLRIQIINSIDRKTLTERLIPAANSYSLEYMSSNIDMEPELFLEWLGQGITDVEILTDLEVPLEQYIPSIRTLFEGDLRGSSVGDLTYFSGTSFGQAIRILEKINSDEAASVLLDLQRNPSWDARVSAAKAFKFMNNRKYELLLRGIDNKYNSLALLEALNYKDADYRRSVAFIFTQLGYQSQEVEDELLDIINNSDENVHIRWLIASVLQELGHDMEVFLSTERLIEPQKLNNCPNDNKTIYGYKPEDDFLLYSGRCVYGFDLRSGNGLIEFYQTLKRLLER